MNNFDVECIKMHEVDMSNEIYCCVNCGCPYEKDDLDADGLCEICTNSINYTVAQKPKYTGWHKL
jgi:hypothetical protein